MRKKAKDKQHKNEDEEYPKREGERNNSLRGRRYGKPKVHCYVHNKIRHYSSKCWDNESNQIDEQINYVKKRRK